jgi:ubiquitin related modifier 1
MSFPNCILCLLLNAIRDASGLFLSGGMELLFDNAKKLNVEVPDTIATMKDLLPWIRDSKLKQRPELFMQGSTV